jgi:cell division protein FtsI/penicillin-binding protein 2
VSRRLWIIILAVVVVGLVAAGVPTGLTLLKHRQERAQRAAADSFARAWRGAALGGIGYANAQSSTVGQQVQQATAGLTTAAKDAPSEVTVSSLSKVAGNKNAVTAHLDVTWNLTGDRVWRYSTGVDLIHKNGNWLPQYQPSVIHPLLTTGAVLRASTQQPKRGEIIGADGEVLVTERPVVTIGMVRSRMDDVNSSVSQVAAITGVDGAALKKRVKAAGKDTFVEVITLREDAYQAVRDQLQPIPGAVFQQTTRSLAPTTDFARALLGTVGTATAEIVKESTGRVQVGDLTGLSGLQRSYDEQLSGTPGLTVTMVPPSTVKASTAKAQPKVLFTAASVAGKPVQITLDEKIQKAAETALKSATKPAALVAIRPGTGAVLAIANGGPNASGYDRALLGRYPPGSTFKVASTLALFGAGITPKTIVQCPAKITVGGREFKNAEAEKLGAVQFHTDFANSCNTAFVGSSKKISSSELAQAAKSLGYGQPNKLGVTAFTGSVPGSGDAVAHAAAMIGQDKVLTSPVTVAGASAAVAAGSWTPPRLVLKAGETLAAGGPDSVALPKGADADLQKLMREVVTKGTGTGLKSVPGGPVSGKTGTAEFGNDQPPQTHAWFTGFQGNLAFAVVVEGGGFGAKAAGPIVKDFLTELDGSAG